MPCRKAVLLGFSLWALAASAQAEVCGYVSTTTKPPAAKAYFPAVITEVDGKAIADDDARRIKLSVGRHLLGIQERIADERAGAKKLAKLKRANARPTVKILAIEVLADGNYLIAAQLFEERIDPKQPDAFWEPVVWRKTLGACK